MRTALALGLVGGLVAWGAAGSEPGWFEDDVFSPLPADGLATVTEAEAPLPDPLPVVPQVEDGMFAVLLGMIEEDVTGVLSRERLQRELRRNGQRTQLPVEYLHWIKRSSLERSPRARVDIRGDGDLDLPVPYRILIYRPGSFRASGDLGLLEWDLGTLRLSGGRDHKGDSLPEVELEDVRLWGVEKGWVEIDVDGWVDRLMGGRLDDTQVVGFALFRYEGELLGLAMGYNPKGKGRSGAFNFRTDRILFPGPPALKTAGAYLRGRLERLLPAVTDRRTTG